MGVGGVTFHHLWVIGMNVYYHKSPNIKICPKLIPHTPLLALVKILLETFISN